MASGNRYLWKKRSVKQKRIRAPYLESCPQKKAVCSKVYTTKPKKPNSAIRKVAKVFILSIKKSVIVSIPGQGHNLQEHSVILMREVVVKIYQVFIIELFVAFMIFYQLKIFQDFNEDQSLVLLKIL